MQYEVAQGPRSRSNPHKEVAVVGKAKGGFVVSYSKLGDAPQMYMVKAKTKAEALRVFRAEMLR
jgi:hypothetical protein